MFITGEANPVDGDRYSILSRPGPPFKVKRGWRPSLQATPPFGVGGLSQGISRGWCEGGRAGKDS